MCLSGSLKTELVLLSEISVKLIILFLLKEKKKQQNATSGMASLTAIKKMTRGNYKLMTKR